MSSVKRHLGGWVCFVEVAVAEFPGIMSCCEEEGSPSFDCVESLVFVGRFALRAKVAELEMVPARVEEPMEASRRTQGGL